MDAATLTARIGNRLSELSDLARRLEHFARARRLDDSSVHTLQLVVEELVSNTILHGFDDDDAHQIRVEVSARGDDLEVMLEDDATPFDPREAPRPDVTAPLDERPIGGLGVHLVRNAVDHFDYQRAGDRNRVTLRFRVRTRDGTEPRA